MGVLPSDAPSGPPSLTARRYAYHEYTSHTESHQDHHGVLSRDSLLIIIIPIISIVLAFAVCLFVILLRKLRSGKNNGTGKSSNDNSNINNIKLCRFGVHRTRSFSASPDVKSGCFYGGNSGHIPLAKFRGVQVFTYKELELATDGFSEANVIGKGGHGVVYRGTLGDGTVAAIKMVHREGKQGEREFRIEVDLLSRLHSPYLVELLGYCADQQHRLLIFEYMPNGSLHHHIHRTHKQYQPLDWATRLRIALDCARALEFLHELAVPTVIHRNFKCSNILLDQNLRAKASDFGLAKTGPDRINSQITTTVVGTTGYLAPECASTGKLTAKSDVYGYGVVLLELLTGRIPVDTKRPPGEHFLVSWALPRLTNREKVVEMVDPALKGQYSKKELIQVAAIAAVCVQPEADYRPLMTDVVQSLIPLVKTIPSTYTSTSSRFQTISPRS
ncbi:PREDICTED: serine/threonine-protein kinase CDL1-like [Nelumbo nucifera]|uniref:Serine/threonine-protein kinase CDL1-like n=2 Tax=Nelumbo nucifera TaxID=4432 RepID=A0A1U8A2H1_NELNU|nr:PREDICTED: serine/threonine-protein kinase CDL1-like [Nelumbo nucifera]DAD19411.1 TPA_asm: hypothetical protein HUJ06_020874 [Nelumbo nucifera]